MLFHIDMNPIHEIPKPFLLSYPLNNSHLLILSHGIFEDIITQTIVYTDNN